MKAPHNGLHVIMHPSQDGNTITYAVSDLDVSVLDNGFLVPCAGYAVASFQLINKSTTLLSTGVVSLTCSNDPNGDIAVAHPAAVTKSAAGMSSYTGLPHAYVGCQVTTAQASVLVDLWLTLRKGTFVQT